MSKTDSSDILAETTEALLHSLKECRFERRRAEEAESMNFNLQNQLKEVRQELSVLKQRQQSWGSHQAENNAQDEQSLSVDQDETETQESAERVSKEAPLCSESCRMRKFESSLIETEERVTKLKEELDAVKRDLLEEKERSQRSETEHASVQARIQEENSRLKKQLDEDLSKHQKEVVRLLDSMDSHLYSLHYPESKGRPSKNSSSVDATFSMFKPTFASNSIYGVRT